MTRMNAITANQIHNGTFMPRSLSIDAIEGLSRLGWSLPAGPRAGPD